MLALGAQVVDDRNRIPVERQGAFGRLALVLLSLANQVRGPSIGVSPGLDPLPVEAALRDFEHAPVVLAA
jgi:hypothetical protein